jgi:hypothetical protein
MQRVGFAVVAAGVAVLAGGAAPASACHLGQVVGCAGEPPPETSLPFAPQAYSSLADQRTSAHGNLVAGFTQGPGEQFIGDTDIDVGAGFDFDLDAPNRGEKLADVHVAVDTDAGPSTLDATVIDDNQDSLSSLTSTYHWEARAAGVDNCPIFAARDADDGHLHVDFTTCQDVIDLASASDAHIRDFKVTFLGKVGGKVFITNPALAGTYAIKWKMKAYDVPNTELPPGAETSSTVQVVDRIAKTVQLDPVAAARRTGTTHTLVATVLDQGNTAGAGAEPLPGADVDFAVTSGPHAGTSCLDRVTNAAGKASCSYTGTAVGDDVISVTATKNGGTASAGATVDWDAPTTLTLQPAFATKNVRRAHTLTATLLDDDGEAIAGEIASFTVVAGPHAGTSGSAATDATGRASFTYTGTELGTDTVQVQAAGLSATASVEWVPPPPVGSIVMTPESAGQKYMGTDTVTFDVVVRDTAGDLMADVEVHFEVVAGPNAGDVQGDRTTGADGKAGFSYSGSRENGEGTDTLEARAGDSADTSTVTWDTDPCDDAEVVFDQPFGGGTTRLDNQATVNGQSVEADACARGD